MNKKKWAIGAAGVLMSLSLAACGQGSKSVATTNGGKITQQEYYDKMKSTQQGKQQLQQMILNKVLEHDYGSKVKQSDVNAQFNQFKSQYGSQFPAMLQQQGMTEDQLKDSIKDNLLLKEAVMKKTSFSNKDLKKQFKDFQPKVAVGEIQTKDQDTAQNAISDLNNGQKWNDVVKKYSTNSANKKDGGKLPAFDNTSSEVDPAVKKAAFKLKNGKYTTDPVKTKQGYVVLKMLKRPAKGTLNQHKAEVKDQLAQKRMNDSNTLHKVVSEVLKSGNVRIEDKDLQNILSGYINGPKQ